MNTAKDGFSGVRAEYTWLINQFPGYKRKAQSLVARGERLYDLLEIETPDGQTRKVYFDVTEFFGKLQ